MVREVDGGEVRWKRGDRHRDKERKWTASGGCSQTKIHVVKKGSLIIIVRTCTEYDVNICGMVAGE